MSSSSLNETLPVLVTTDIGRDVDDALALAYLAGKPNVEIAGVAVTHMIPERRALIAQTVLERLGCDAPVGIGSVFPLSEEDPVLEKYHTEHRVDGRTYEGRGIIACYPEATRLIHETIDHYPVASGPSQLNVVAIGPLTDLAKAAREDVDHFCSIGGLYIQGQAYEEGGRIKPDLTDYNFRVDKAAAVEVFELQDRVPFTVVGKYAPKAVPLVRGDFDTLAGTGHPVGTYLREHAEQGIACFMAREPEKCQRLYDAADIQPPESKMLSVPYDVLVAKAIARPEGLIPKQVGRHAIIGMTPEENGIEDATAIKADLLQTMLSALVPHP